MKRWVNGKRKIPISDICIPVVTSLLFLLLTICIYFTLPKSYFNAIHGWMDGWMDGWMGGLMVHFMHAYMDGSVGRWFDSCVEEWMDV